MSGGILRGKQRSLRLPLRAWPSQRRMALQAFLLAASFFLAVCTVAGQEQARELLRAAEKAESEGHYA